MLKKEVKFYKKKFRISNTQKKNFKKFYAGNVKHVKSQSFNRVDSMSKVLFSQFFLSVCDPPIQWRDEWANGDSRRESPMAAFLSLPLLPLGHYGWEFSWTQLGWVGSSTVSQLELQLTKLHSLSMQDFSRRSAGPGSTSGSISEFFWTFQNVWKLKKI